MLQNRDDAKEFYLGYSENLKRRFEDHNLGRSRATRGRQWRLVYYEAYLTKEAAMKREHVLKGDGRTRRYLMERIRTMLALGHRENEPFSGGEWQTGE